MVSPAWRHRARILAQKAREAQKKALQKQQKEVINEAAKENSKFELLLQSLENDRKRISSFPRGPERVKLKKEEIIPTYLPVAMKYIAGPEVYKNEVLVQTMIWLFDSGAIDEAMQLARVAIDQKQPMPERFKRDVKTFVADAVKDWAAHQLENNRAIEPYFSEVASKIIATDGDEPEWLVHEDIRITYLKIQGQVEYAANRLKEAMSFFVLAENLNPKKAKVKTILAKIRKKLELEK